MATIKEITAMCKAGETIKAYELVKADLENTPSNVWTQRGLSWVIYYLMKEDVENRKRQEFFVHLKELTELDMLTVESDSMIFENVLWKLAEYLKYIPDENTEEIDRLFTLFGKYRFRPSKGYSFLLRSVLGFEAWSGLVAFFEWWDMDNLLPEDYQPFQLENGRKIMSLAEQAYIAYSKALLRLGDKHKIQAFLPKMEQIVDNYPEMMYPGYFCGKLMLAMGADKADTLDTLMPFVRKKQSEFWVWQLMGEVYKDEKDMQLACLLCASYCRTQETFLGKVRMKLISLYVSKGDYPRAKYHLDKITRCYVQQGWRLPIEVQHWMKEAWVQNTVADSSDGIDYKKYINAILTHDANESIAIVTYVDCNRKRVFLVYGKEQRTSVRNADLRVPAKVGLLVNLKWMPATDNINIVGAEVVDSSVLKSVSYIRLFDSKVERHSRNPFAFVKKDGISCYICPKEVQRHQLDDGDPVSVLAVWDYNKKKAIWNWSCVILNKR